jgi:FeS assembly SUF system protein
MIEYPLRFGTEPVQYTEERTDISRQIVGDTTEERVISAIRTVYDPEIPVNLYDLGLIYNIDVSEGGTVDIRMTLTAPACPVAGILPQQVQNAVEQVPEICKARVELVWDPPWSQACMTEEAKLELGML